MTSADNQSETLRQGDNSITCRLPQLHRLCSYPEQAREVKRTGARSLAVKGSQKRKRNRGRASPGF